MKKILFLIFRSKTLLLCLILVTLSISASAQEKKVEISGDFGYTVAEGIDISPTTLAGVSVNKVGVNSGSSYGFQGDYFIDENSSLGFLWSRQNSGLTATLNNNGAIGQKVFIANMAIYNYQFVFTYNMGEETAKVRPFFFGGLGWSAHSPGEFQPALPAGATGTDLNTRNTFAGTLGAGVKYFMAPSVGLKFSARWTPTYIGTEPSGVWCNPWYCSTVGISKYSNQGEFTGGLIFRF
jgi:outer membrane protein W